MARKTDLEGHIRESYQIILECEDIVRVSSDPKEKTRNRRMVQEQRELIRQYLAEYQPLCAALDQPPPDDIAEIAISARSFTDIPQADSKLAFVKYFSNQQVQVFIRRTT